MLFQRWLLIGSLGAPHPAAELIPRFSRGCALRTQSNGRKGEDVVESKRAKSMFMQVIAAVPAPIPHGGVGEGDVIFLHDCVCGRGAISMLASDK